MAIATRIIRRLAVLSVLLTLSMSPRANDGTVLTDVEVDAILDAGSAGVFYAWSPHMPLSVDGLREIIAAGEQLDVLVVPVLSPHANVAYARDRLQDRGLPGTYLRMNDSVELVNRDLFLHAPAIIVFSGGEFVSPVLPGLRRADDYVDLIGRFIAAAGE